jgi:hypothetical protein
MQRKTKGSLSLRQTPFSSVRQERSKREREREMISVSPSLSPLRDEGNGSGTLSRVSCLSSAPSSHWLLFPYEEFRERLKSNAPPPKSFSREVVNPINVIQTERPSTPKIHHRDRPTYKRIIEDSPEENEKHWECQRCTLLNNLDESWFVS